MDLEGSDSDITEAKRYFPPKSWFPTTRPHGVKIQKLATEIFTAVQTSVLTPRLHPPKQRENKPCEAVTAPASLRSVSCLLNHVSASPFGAATRRHDSLNATLQTFLLLTHRTNSNSGLVRNVREVCSPLSEGQSQGTSIASQSHEIRTHSLHRASLAFVINIRLVISTWLQIYSRHFECNGVEIQSPAPTLPLWSKYIKQLQACNQILGN